VYTKNHPAIALYEKCGFNTLNADVPVLDPDENNESYFIMAKRLPVAPSPQGQE
jgi:ribosomal protein S18 acetylase RimI-like enzyme